MKSKEIFESCHGRYKGLRGPPQLVFTGGLNGVRLVSTWLILSESAGTASDDQNGKVD